MKKEKRNMGEYSLVDIHFHTEDSYDTESEMYNWDDIRNELVDKVKLLVKTDHNRIGFSSYLDQKEKLRGINYFPGVELNIKTNEIGDKVHWIFIFNPDEMIQENDQGIMKGINFENAFNKLLYNKEEPTDDDFKNFTCINSKEIIDLIISFELDVIAIPHLYKSAGYNPSLSNTNILELNSKIYQNIIFGFESKEYASTYQKKINKTSDFIKKLENGEDNPSSSDLERRVNYVDFMRILEAFRQKTDYAIIYGSDFHLNRNTNQGSFCTNISGYSNLIPNLFYIRSEPTFNGLKLSLSEPQSRIVKYEDIDKVKKINSNVIEELYMDIDGKPTKLSLGSNLNSIIGLKGSGKSFILNSIADEAEDYNEGAIQKVTNFKIKFREDDKYYLPEDVKNRFEFIRQKNSNNYAEKVGIYDVLMDAPYNEDIFMKVLSDHTNAENFTTENKLHLSFNNLFRNVQEIMNIENSIILDVEEIQLMNNESDSVEVKARTLFNNTIDITKKHIVSLDKRHEEIGRIISFFSDTEFSLSAKEKKYLSAEQLRYFNSFDPKEMINIYKIIENNISDNIELGQNLNKITSQIYNNINNKTTIISQTINSKKDNIKSNIFKLYNLNIEIEQNKNEILNTETKYTSNIYTLNDDIEIKIENEVSLNDLHSIFSNYNSGINNLITKLNNNIMNLLNNNLTLVYESIKLKTKNKKPFFSEFPLEKKVIVKIGDEDPRSITHMSAGERTELILDIILGKGDYNPLLIDQPEDDLDNRTIYYYLVNKIKKLKFKRQIIIVSHNANMVLNADSDYIISCHRDDENFAFNSVKMESLDKIEYIDLDGNVSSENILTIASNILEGGSIALERRVKKIGYKNIFLNKMEGERDED